MKHASAKIRAGLIGVGNWGRYGHIPSLQLLPEYEIAAICSRSRKNGEELARQFGIARSFVDPEELVAHEEVDLVIVLPPVPQHAGLVRSALAAGKDVYCEWPLTTTLADSEDLLARATAAGAHHVVGLQHRVGASARYLRDLLSQGYVGELRSVRMHVSMAYFGQLRPRDLAWSIPQENFSHIHSIYSGHFLDLLFWIVGGPLTVSSVVVPQFPDITIAETGETFPNRTPDQVLVIGQLSAGGVFTVQIEGGKANNSGVQIDFTGTQGDLRVSNEVPFGNAEDNRIEGAQGSGQPLRELPIPDSYQWIPSSTLDVSVQDLAQLYRGFSLDRENGTHQAPTFVDAVRLHKLIELISRAHETGIRQTVDFW